MSMTRDTYAKEVIRAAEAAFHRNETAVCPHENCNERLSVVQQNTFSTRSLFCTVHGHIFQEQEIDRHSRLDWEAAQRRQDERCAAGECEVDGPDYDEGEYELEGFHEE